MQQATPISTNYNCILLKANQILSKVSTVLASYRQIAAQVNQRNAK
jgi:hypothetical protein